MPVGNVPFYHGGNMELSDYYQRLPGTTLDGPGPVDFIKEESLQFDAVSDLDRFFDRLYHYYNEKGFSCIVCRWVCELLVLGFTILFSATLFLFINWEGLFNKCGSAAAVPGCDLMKEAIYEHPLQPFTFYKFIILCYLAPFTLYWWFCFLKFFAQLKETLEIKDFVHKSLGITEDELQTTPWPVILDGVVQQRLCVVRHLSSHDVVMRIMRKENYLIGMLNKGIIKFSLAHWVPGAGPRESRHRGADNRRFYLSKSLEWVLNWFFFQNMFDRRFSIDRDFLNNPAVLKQRLRRVGICMIVFSPFLMLFMLVYFFLRHAEHFYSKPGRAFSRRWSNLATWTFREFNELDHLFNQRLNASHKPAVAYVEQFSSPMTTMWAKSISFITGGISAFIFIVAFIDERLLEAHLFGYKLLLLGGVFAAIAAISRLCIAEDYLVFNPEETMKAVAQHTHFMPRHWRNHENSPVVRSEFGKLFQYMSMMLVEELCSVVVTGWVLLYELPKCVDEMLLFVQEYTVTIQGVGDVCSLSVFDFAHHGNPKYASPCNTAKDRRSTQGKMEKSFLGFKSNYPNWEPDANGKQFLTALEQFKTRHEDLTQSQMRSTVLGPSIHGSIGSFRDQANTISGSTLVQADQMFWLDQFYANNTVDEGDIESLGELRNGNDFAPSLLDSRRGGRVSNPNGGRPPVVATLSHRREPVPQYRPQQAVPPPAQYRLVQTAAERREAAPAPLQYRPVQAAGERREAAPAPLQYRPVQAAAERREREELPQSHHPVVAPEATTAERRGVESTAPWWRRKTSSPDESSFMDSMFQPPQFRTPPAENGSESEGEQEGEWLMKRQSFTNEGEGDQFDLPFVDDRPHPPGSASSEQQRPLVGGDSAAGAVSSTSV